MMEFVRYSCGLEAGMEAGPSKPTPTAEQIPTGLRRYDSRLDPPAKSRDVSWWAARTAQPRSQWLRLRAWFLGREKPAHEQLALGRDFRYWGLILAIGKLLEESDRKMDAGLELESMRLLYMAKDSADGIDKRDQRIGSRKKRTEMDREKTKWMDAYFTRAYQQLAKVKRKVGPDSLVVAAERLARADGISESDIQLMTPSRAKSFKKRLAQA